MTKDYIAAWEKDFDNLLDEVNAMDEIPEWQYTRLKDFISKAVEEARAETEVRMIGTFKHYIEAVYGLEGVSRIFRKMNKDIKKIDSLSHPTSDTKGEDKDGDIDTDKDCTCECEECMHDGDHFHCQKGK